MKILIADDQFENRKLLRDLLKSVGSCDMVDNGRAALELFTADLEDDDPYDLVLLDIIMPGMDGQKALNRIRAKEKELATGAPEAVIFMVTSMDSSLQAMQAYFKGGSNDYLNKPITREVLFDKLREHSLLEDE